METARRYETCKNEYRETTKRRTDREAGKYRLLALMTGLFLFGGLLLIEHMPMVQLAAAVLFCIVSAVCLLYALMKLQVMEFQPGSFWYRLNLYVNRNTSAGTSGRQAARSTVYAMIINDYK
ncbi:MAG: hypothetical protein IJA90_04485 [Peptococcaceae bacterium]|nr:hypothetical protein [Peptococcaceae bacterium]